MKTIKCERCGIEIEKKGRRKYCNKCRRIVDDELAKEYCEKYKREKMEDVVRIISGISNKIHERSF